MTTSRRYRVLVLTPVALMLVIGTLIGAVGTAAVGAPSDDKGAFSATKKVTREFRDGTGDTATDHIVDSRDFTLKVDHTRNLRGRERLTVAWSGAHPSGGRAANPYGENGLKQEYPVVIMQCRGIDNPKLPVAKQIRPETCWTSTRQQRSQSNDELFAVWRHDLYATEAQREQKSGLDPIPANCSDNADFSTHLTPFVAANGTTYPACTSETMPPEAAVGASFPPAEIAGYTGLDGRGRVSYEVRSAIENESLGCSDKTPCSLVAVPIMGLSCIDADHECRKDGRMEPGSSNFANEGVDAAVSPVYWWSASNWRNRVTVPLSFGLPPDACTVLDSRAPTAFYGSELMSQAALQWSPAYCLRKDRFKFQHVTLGDEAAFALVEKGAAPAAFVSGTRERETTDPVGYAPTALTGFAIAFIVDQPDNAGERTSLNLTPRLIAKLLTQSYAGSSLGLQHPGMASNPLSLNTDPEFRALNPGLDSIAREAASTVLSLSESSDVVRTLTAYLDNDPEARAFIGGKADPWGMVVNPSYRGLKLPVSDYPLLDTFIPTSEQACLKANPSVYFSQLAAPLNSLRRIAEAVLDAWPNVQTRCDRASADDPYKVGRIDRQGIGSRFMLGLVSLGDAQRFGLRTASLQTTSSASPIKKFTSDTGRTFIAPTNASVLAAAAVATSAGPHKAFSMTMPALQEDPSAYPGTMVVYTAARLKGLDKDDARKVSEFIDISTTEGQVRGSGNGKLPEGFVPITRSGATAALWKQAQQVADLIREQKVDSPTPTKPTPQPSVAAPHPDLLNAVAAPPAVAPAASNAKQTTETIQTAATAAHSSGAAGALLPLLILAALAAGVAGPVTRVVATLRARR